MSDSKQPLVAAISSPYTLATTSAVSGTGLTLHDLKLTYAQLAGNVSASIQPTYLMSPYQAMSLSNIHLSGIRQFITPAQEEPKPQPPAEPTIDTWEEDLSKLMEALRS